jgi:hypothetical protein
MRPIFPDISRFSGLYRDPTEQMKSGRLSCLIWPLILAAAFFFIPVVLFSVYPVGFWSSTDYEPLGLADALNMAYRLGDLTLYPAEGMTNHPGVQFYLTSWLALALSGHPIATGQGYSFFRDVVDHVEDYHRMAVYVATLAGSAGIFLFARTALKLIPPGVTVAALLLWLVSTPATILCFMATGFEPFALLINGIFLVMLFRIAFDRELDPWMMVLAGCVGAFAYLDKLAYAYIPLALVSAIFWKAVFCGIGWRRGAKLIAISFFTFVGVVIATGYLVIGSNAFIAMLRFHRNVILGSGLYGTGSQVVVSGEGVRRAIMAIPGDEAWAVPLALIAGAALWIAGIVAGLRNRHDNSVAIIAIGAGLAALFSALSVLKHYDTHYTAGVSAALPGCLLACYLFARNWSPGLRLATVAVVWVAITVMTGPALRSVEGTLAARSETTRLAEADMKQVGAETAGMKRPVGYVYRVPFPQFVEGFVVYFTGVPRLTKEYVEKRGGITNGIAGPPGAEDDGAYVIDKAYFPDIAAVKSAPNLDTQGPKPVQFETGDKLIELHTVFLLIRK